MGPSLEYLKLKYNFRCRKESSINKKIKYYRTGRRLGFDKTLQLLAPAGMAKLAQGLGFYLPDALPGYRKVLTDLFQGMVRLFADSKAHAEDLFFPWSKRGQGLPGLFAQVEVYYRIHRGSHPFVLDKVAEMAVFLFAYRRLKADRLLCDLEHLADLVDRKLHFFGDFFGHRFASEFLHQVARGPDELVDGLDHVDRYPNGPRLVGDGSGDRLPNPPGGVSAEFISALIFELIHRLHQPD